MSAVATLRVGPMSLVNVVAIYFVVWWIVLFAVLPWGVSTQDEAGDVVPGSARSAPQRPRLGAKAAATSIVAGVVVGLIWLAVNVYGIDFATLAGFVDLRR